MWVDGGVFSAYVLFCSPLFGGSFFQFDSYFFKAVEINHQLDSWFLEATKEEMYEHV